MINFRYHLISLVAMFLALAVGVVMGSAVIDKAVVETLEGQQSDIAERVDQAIAENQALQGRLAEIEGRSQRLADEAAPQLLADRLREVPVLVLAMRGVAPEAIDAAVALLDTAGAEHQGTLWFNDRLALTSEEERRDLARALGTSEGLAAPSLRSIAVDALAASLTASGSPAGEVSGGSPVGAGAGVAFDDAVAGLRDTGFVDFDPPEGAEQETAGLAPAGTRVMFVTGPGAVVDDARWARPLVEALAGEAPEPPPVPLLVAESYPPGVEPQAELSAVLRADDVLSTRLSTVSRIDDFAGQVAVVLALQDLGEGRVGHYGRDAQRLIPAPAE
ncbi:MAG: copper transporter [Actinobacteria bacterium]|nr:copper transporter [Actinomycetota bacterium]